MSDNDSNTEAMIQAAGKTAPRVTPAMVQAAIAQEWYFTAWEGAQLAYWGTSNPEAPKPLEGEPDRNGPLALLTCCVLVMQNGFTVMGKSACASPENFDANIGRKVARDDAISQVWPLEGYLLKQRLHEAIESGPKSPESTRPAYQQRVVDERDQLRDKIIKLSAYLVTPSYARLDDIERVRLADQLDIMNDYARVLEDRIDAFNE